MNIELHHVREEIRKADEELVRELAAASGEAEDGWTGRPTVRRRIALGLKVAECKFRHEPERFRALARACDERGLERAITDVRTEEAVLERVRKQALACGSDNASAERLVTFYRDQIIPETKTVQIRRLCELG